MGAKGCIAAVSSPWRPGCAIVCSGATEIQRRTCIDLDMQWISDVGLHMRIHANIDSNLCDDDKSGYSLHGFGTAEIVVSS